MGDELTAEQRSQAALAVIRGLVRHGQLVEAVQALDTLLDGTDLALTGTLLGNALVDSRYALDRLADALAPTAATPLTPNATMNEDEAHG